jgi:hypothetical protein
MLFVCLYTPQTHYDIIDKDDDKPIDKQHEHPIHHIHKGHLCIRQPNDSTRNS